MKYSQVKTGRTFVLRLEHSEIVHESIEKFARQESIQAAGLILLGGADKESKLVVGPSKGEDRPVTPMHHILQEVHEVAGTGTIFPDEGNLPALHLHLTCGRGSGAVTGCARAGVRVWQIMEGIIIELKNCPARRVIEPSLGFPLLSL